MNPLNVFAGIIVSGLLLLVGNYTNKQSIAQAVVKPSTVRIYSIDIKTKTNGRDMGNYTIYSQRVLSPEGQLIGNAYETCFIVRSGIQQCAAIFNLPEGKISIQGTRDSRKRYTFVVTGGTGVYMGVGGRLRAVAFGINPFREKITIELV